MGKNSRIQTHLSHPHRNEPMYTGSNKLISVNGAIPPYLLQCQISSIQRDCISRRYQPELMFFESMVIRWYKMNPVLEDGDVMVAYYEVLVINDLDEPSSPPDASSQEIVKQEKEHIANAPNPELVTQLTYQLLAVLQHYREQQTTQKALDQILSCLINSVITWNKRFGAQGYLDYVASFFP